MPTKETFDTRNVVLDIDPDRSPESRDQWEAMQASVTRELIAELGVYDAEAKIENYRAMGVAPWSVVFQHNKLLEQVRSAFAHGDFYPALVAACSLGERILNQLTRVLAGDYINHASTTAKARQGRPQSNWSAAIDMLTGWGVLSDQVSDAYRELKDRRNAAVHYTPSVPAEAREPALAALKLVQLIIDELFSPHGGPPRFIGEAEGSPFIARDAERDPFVKRIFIPVSVLVSPEYEVRSDDGGRSVIFDNPDYPADALTDQEFARELRDARAARRGA